MNKMIAFHGVDAKVGTTMISQAVAQMTAACNRDWSVVWVGLNSKPEVGYLGSAASVEQLQIDLRHRFISRQELIAGCVNKDNLSILPGVLSYSAARYFRPETAKDLLDQLSSHFDVVVADTGNQLDDGLTVGALERIACRIGVFTQHESALRCWVGLHSLYERLEFDFKYWVINRYLSRDIYDKAYISTHTGIAEDHLLPVTEAVNSRRAEAERRTLLAYRESGFKEDIARILNRIGWLRRSCPDGGLFKRERKWIFSQ
jgi:MinD-like ATPase involved in chromosome partitioning or flagellar assembly